MIENRKGLIYSIIGTLLLSTNFITAKYALKAYNLQTFTLFWSFMATFYSILIVVFSNKISRIKISKRHFNSLFFLGLFTGIGMILTWAGLSRLDPLFSSFLWKFAPVFTVILGVLFLNEKLEIKEIMYFIVMVAGGMISAVGNWNIIGTGVLFTLAACIAGSIPMLIAKKLISDIDPEIMLMFRNIIAFVVVIIWAVSSGTLDYPSQARYTAVLLIGALIGPTLSFLFLFKSYKYWDLSHTTIVSTLDSIFILPMAYIVFGEIIQGRRLVGGVIILIGALLFIRQHFLKNDTEKN